MTTSYDDIINLPRHVSSSRPQMPTIKRAAQFAPFAALTGHEEAVKETARLTSERIELADHLKYTLNHQLNKIAAQIKDNPKIAFTHFRPDPKKTGGEYVITVGEVKKIDEYHRTIIMVDGTTIPIAELISIDMRP